MFNDLLIHESVASALLALAKDPPHALLLVGPKGVGKGTIATAWAQHVAGHPTRIRIINPDDKGTLTIEMIRNLYVSTRSRQEGRRVFIIDGADHMSIEAENAFLKLLEEPSTGLTFILTAQRLESLLPTIISRAQQITLQPMPDDAIRRLIMGKKPGIASVDAAQLVFLAQGRPGIAFELMADNELPTQRERMKLAKQLITDKPYERLLHINKLAADRDNCIAGLEAMARIVEIQLKTANGRSQLAYWLSLSQALEIAMQGITNNGNIRSQLLQLFTSY